MIDQSVVVKLLNSSGSTVFGTHIFNASGSPDAVVKIDTSTAEYQTTFKRGDIGVTAPGTYKAEVYFVDVDGNLVMQGSSPNVTF
jgi:hypothetical protein